MPKWYHPDVLDKGLVELRDNTTMMHLITSFTAGEDYATVIGRSICSFAMSAVDLPIGNQGTNNRQITVASKTSTATAPSPATPDLHLALVDATLSRVLSVGNELSDREILTGDTIITPVWYNINSQPV